MTLLCFYCAPSSDTTNTIIISLVSSGLFALIVFLLNLFYDYIKYSRHETTYTRPYTGDNENLKGEIAAIAKVKYRYKNEMQINVETLINEHGSPPYKFPEANVQEWEGLITMESLEAGKLYFYYIRPEEQKKENRSEFKRVLFLHNSTVLKLFGQNGYGEELFYRK